MYFILGLPRSRTTWLAAFLSTDTQTCYHEKSLEFSSLEDLKIFVQEEDCGITDTALLVHWRWLISSIPEAKLVVIDRPYSEVIDSLAEIGFSDESKLTLAVSNQIEVIKQESDILVIPFHSLSSKETIVSLCKYLEVPFNNSKFIEFSEMMIQPNKDLLLERMSKNLSNIQSMYGEWL